MPPQGSFLPRHAVLPHLQGVRHRQNTVRHETGSGTQTRRKTGTPWMGVTRTSEQLL